MGKGFDQTTPRRHPKPRHMTVCSPSLVSEMQIAPQGVPENAYQSG